jgi:hypothetical protein
VLRDAERSLDFFRFNDLDQLAAVAAPISHNRIAAKEAISTSTV